MGAISWAWLYPCSSRARFRTASGGSWPAQTAHQTARKSARCSMRTACSRLPPRGGTAMWLEMKVKGLALDPLSNMPIIILRDDEEKRSLPIWVGLFEANAIALELEKISTARPLTHDLIKNLLEAVGARVAKVVVNDLRENTFYAVIHLRLGSNEVTVDSRPSDAIALALRVDAPIYVAEEVLGKAESVEVK